MMLRDQIQADLNTALKNRDQVQVDTLRFLLGAVHDLEIAKYPPSSKGMISDEDVTAVIQKQVKTHRESIEMFAKGGRQDLVDREESQLKILEGYLPEQMSEREIRNKIEEIRKMNPGADFGSLMKVTMAEFKGKADGAVVARLLKEITKE